MKDEELWREELGIIGNDLCLWNQNVIPWMEKRGDEYKRFAHAAARRRGWRYDRSIHGYISPPDATPEERNAVMQELGRQELRRWLKGKQTFGKKGSKAQERLAATWIPKVLACWQITAPDDTGLLVIWDMRKMEGGWLMWNGVPRRLYDALREKGAQKTLDDIRTIYAGQELDSKQAMQVIHDIEADILMTG